MKYANDSLVVNLLKPMDFYLDRGFWSVVENASE